MPIRLKMARPRSAEKRLDVLGCRCPHELKTCLIHEASDHGITLSDLVERVLQAHAGTQGLPGSLSIEADLVEAAHEACEAQADGILTDVERVRILRPIHRAAAKVLKGIA